MADKNNFDLFEKLQLFQHELRSNRPSKQEMIAEVRMMNFRVKPIQGEISQLDFKNSEFLDALWDIGKLDEFFKKELPELAKQEREVFLRLINELRFVFQSKLNQSQLLAPKTQPNERYQSYELEIVKNADTKVH